MIVLCGTDDPLQDPSVRARPPAARFGSVVDTAMVPLCTCVDDTRDRGGGGTEEANVDPSGMFMGPRFVIASSAIGRVGWVVGGGMGERDEFKIGAVV